jgi:hypothetical protein
MCDIVQSSAPAAKAGSSKTLYGTAEAVPYKESRVATQAEEDV